MGFSNIACEVICTPSFERGRALITREFGEHAAAIEDVAGVISKNERLTLLRLLKKLGKHAAETRK